MMSFEDKMISSIRSSDKLQRDSLKDTSSPHNYGHSWTTGTILMPPVLREGSLRATELGDLQTSA